MEAVETLERVLEKYELVDVHLADPSSGSASFLVVSERPGKQFDTFNPVPPGFDLDLIGELGSTSPSPWTGWLRQEYNPEMRGVEGLRNFDKMRRSDATVRSSLRLMKTPVLAARWYMEPASESVRDQNVCDFVWENLTCWMSTSWPQFLTECMLMLEFGYYMFEKVFWPGELVTNDPRARGKLVWKKLAPRHPMDVTQWYWDPHGGPLGVEMYDPENVRYVDIPIDKLLVFTFDKEAGDMTGISLLRSAYKHWYYKEQLYKIDAIQKERHGIGIPVIKLPPGYGQKDKNEANELGRNLRTNERAHVVLPPNWDLIFAKLEGQPVDAMTSIKHHDIMIWNNVLAPFMDNNTTTKQEDQTMFLKSTRFLSDIICDVLNKYAIPQLVNMNWTRVKYPKLCARRIGEQADQRTTSFGVRNLVGAGLLTPDDRLEASLREEFDLPKADPTTARVMQLPDPQMPGMPVGEGNQPPTGPKPPKAGLPRQQPLPKVGVPAKNEGTDRSGG